MADAKWMVYGANGYTGELIAEVAQRRGLAPILAGRNEAAVRAVADRLGMPHRVFSLDGPDSIAENLADVDAVVAAAGPFSATSKPMVDGCLAAHTHYLDITGELAVFEACHARDAEAERAGIAVMPGVGFDVVPSDCLAKSLAEALPSATSLELAFKGGSMSSRGTLKSSVEALGHGGFIRKDGAIEQVPTAWKQKRVPFRDHPRTCVSIPWGDVSTAYYSTGIPNIIVYTYLGKRAARAAKIARPVLPIFKSKRVQDFLKRRIDRAPAGPDEQTRATAQCQLWGRVEDADGRSVEGTLVTPEGYRLTAECAVESVVRVIASTLSGALTPSMAFGARYITEFDGCELEIGEPKPARHSA